MHNLASSPRSAAPVSHGTRRALPRLAAALSLCILLASGCTMAPDYLRPESPAPETYETETELTGRTVPPQWKQFFTDPVIQRLVHLALDNNRDLRVAVLHIEKVRAQYGIQRADLLPTVSAAAESSAQRLPRDVSGPTAPDISRQYSATLGFSGYELDLFGRVRSLTERALETYYSAEMDARSTQLSLVSEVAGAYLQLVANRELLDITQATYDNRKGQYDLVNKKFASGVASRLDVSQAMSIMEEARSNVARYSTSVGQSENALALLLGCPLPKDLPDVRKLADVQMLADVPAGMPSDLLERRPDIQAAEHMLKAANADIGAARANFFPRISLTGSVGTLSTDAADLFGSGAGFWSFVPSVSLPLFDTGRNIASLEMSEAERDMAVAQYEKSIQSAFREVADTLVQRRFIDEQLDAENSLVRSPTNSYDLAAYRYDVGIDSYLNVLDAQRSLYSAQQSHIATKLLRETNALTLYKALGGGWK